MESKNTNKTKEKQTYKENRSVVTEKERGWKADKSGEEVQLYGDRW